MLPAGNHLLADTATPPIPEAKAWLAAYDGAQGPAIDLSQAAPGSPPPALLLDALAEAAADPATARYGPIAGDQALREAYAADLCRAYDGPFTAEDSVITTGCNQAFVLAMLALARAGDAVMLPAPWYFNHRMALDMLGLATEALPCRPENGFVPDPADAARLISPRTRVIVLVTPNNPTGAVYPPDVIADFAALAAERGLWLVLDETYRDFLPPEQARPHGLFAAGVPEHVLSLYSFSKAYAIPGYRLGAITLPRRLAPSLGKALDTLQICPPRIGQIAVARTMAATLPWREANRAAIHARGEAFRRAFAQLNDWRIGSVGAYFAYVQPPTEDGGAAATARRLALEHGVLMLPGRYFGTEQEHWARVAFANADEPQLLMLGDRLRAASRSR
jgi:aspartate/methionine/tyrosine aminotransferase